MQMTFKDILETLKYSVNFEEFMITYNELIPDIVKAKKISFSDYMKFKKVKNEMKKKFYDDYCKEYPNDYIRFLRESKYIYDIDITDALNELKEITDPIYKFKIRLDKLR